MLVKILGAVDLAAALALLLKVFGLNVLSSYLLFCAGLLFLKGLFIFAGEPLSLVDLISSVLLAISIFTTPYIFLLWCFSLLLIAKGVVSFI